MLVSNKAVGTAEQTLHVLAMMNRHVHRALSLTRRIDASKYDFSSLKIKNISCLIEIRCINEKHFFRTNYEYDDKCGRTSAIWWPQMLVLCVLVFLILLALLALLWLFRRRQYKIATKYDRVMRVVKEKRYHSILDWEKDRKWWAMLHKVFQTWAIRSWTAPSPIQSKSVRSVLEVFSKQSN